MTDQGHDVIEAMQQYADELRRRHQESFGKLGETLWITSLFDLVYAGDLALRFGRTDRLTRHPDGEPESDTDHTVMLGLIACAFAARFIPRLDLGRVARLALVHDLVEAIAGDVATLHELDEAAKATKQRNEREALEAIRNATRQLPWIADEIDTYESQQCSESRYVWAMDKCMPKITYILSDGTLLREQGMTAERLTRRLERQRAEMAERIHGCNVDLSIVLDLHEVLTELEVRTLTTSATGEE